ncbi:Helicase required for RNAi-mediated heterochromatin assembly 1 [Diplodia seriata]|uniref:Helicase required for RNAi-mediated heterochromatin assembly 1 n=1 Tax=Diplodia seriata TaxID=420778 RepID=A0A1S8B9L4_9PEZI|nr:Helicase required for RNAi-mediated heterochromatin assembly 1 [Diplodia seriata]
MAVPHAIRKYVAEADLPVATDSWLSRPEVPTTEEILDTDDFLNDTVAIPPNNIDGPWSSKETYLESHFELLREDTIRPLREAVGRIRTKSWGKEEEYGSTVGLYSNVHIVGFTFCPRGLAARVQFSLARAGKRIHWEQSKRLLTGSLIVLTPEDDNFQHKCIVAVVAARPLSNLVQDPPEIDIFFPRSEEIEIDPGQSWLMVEERSSYFEGTRHTLRALQKLMRESFPLSEHLISLETAVGTPKYIESNPNLDLTPVFEGVETMNVLQPWPDNLKTELDRTQVQALQRMLTKKCAIIQGPPGTGKTHVSVVALKALLNNMEEGFDAPIIVACQTNHALDQLMRHVAAFEPNFARLGGRSRDEEIKKRTLYELKQADRPPPIAGGSMGPASMRLKKLERQMRTLLSPLQVGSDFLSHTLLRQLNIITEKQFESFERGDTRWESHGAQQDTIAEDRIADWIGKHYDRVERGIPPDDFAFEYEEIDLEFEQLKEIEAENMVKDDEDYETLPGGIISLAEGIVGKHSTSTNVNVTDEDVERLLSKTDNMHKIKDKMRGVVYNYLKSRAKGLILEAFREVAKEYQNAVVQRAVGRWELDHMVLRKQKIIGMTTTGLSKYRALVSSLRPKIILIEEAAETLEAPVTAACVPSLEHLILVGDHQQLRPHCHVSDHENEPFFLNMSLFERLVRNEVEYDTLRRQRRMIPQTRRLIKPIYGDLIKDHPSVKDPAIRAPVPGMGGMDTFFFTHEWPETVDSQMSSCNETEADMIVQFYNYLFMNGMPYSNITVLTFYNGQRKLILRKLRSHPNLQGTGRDFRVVTVDSYQGEENEVILLSLVRNNFEGRVGFLNNVNRVCVALSRAKRGFYMFGNGQLLASESKIWAEVITILAGKKSLKEETMRVGYHLPLTCAKHGRKTFIGNLDDWEMVHGGCGQMCKGQLPCGHHCILHCHPFPHDTVSCNQSCRRILGCGHVCAASCAEECRCTICVRTDGAILRPGARPTLNTGQVALRNDTTVRSRPSQPPGPGAPTQTFRQAGSVRNPPPSARVPLPVYQASSAQSHRRTSSNVSDPVAWQAYAQNVHDHDAEMARRANREYQERLQHLDQRRAAMLEEEMERSVLHDDYQSSPSAVLATADGTSSSATPRAIPTSTGPTPLRQRWVHNYDPSSGSRTANSEPSLLD